MRTLGHGYYGDQVTREAAVRRLMLSVRVWLSVASAVDLQYPLLAGHYSRVAELSGIKEYLASPRRLEKVNNNNLG
jgi:hypothetical protein